MKEMHPTLAAVKEKLHARGITSEYHQLEGGIHQLELPVQSENTNRFIRGLIEELGDSAPEKLGKTVTRDDVRLTNALEAFMATHGPRNIKMDLMPGRTGVMIQVRESNH